MIHNISRFIAALALLATAQTAWATETSTITVGGTDYTLFTGFTATGGNGRNYAKLVDGNTSTDWIAAKSYGEVTNHFAGGTADPAFVEFHADEAFIPKGYVLTCYHENAGFWKPVEWALKAKLNEGDAWTTIQSSTTTLGQGKTFEIACTNDGDNEYQYFRFEVYEVGTTKTLDLDELQFYGSLPAYTHLTVKAATCMATGIKVDCYRRNSDGKYFTDNTGTTELQESDVIAPIIPHTGEHHEATDVNIEYWQCSMCGKYFSDEGYTTEITEEQTKIYRTITIDSSISGLVTLAFSETQALAGTTMYLYVSDLIDASTLKVNDGAVELTAVNDIQYTFTMPAADVTVTAEVAQSNADGDVLTGSIRHTVTIPDGASITLNNATITGSIVCEGSATITLVGTNSVSGAMYKAGIQIGGSGTTLTIKGDGSLTANGGDQSAGIGLSRIWNYDSNVTSGDIVIEGGTITATGGKWGAGIGTGVIKNTNNDNSTSVQFGNVTIKGGTVTATGGDSGDGIGKGYSYTGPAITFGTVTIYDGIDMVDASSIKDFGSVVYMHGENNVTASKTDYFAIGEDGNHRLIIQKLVIAEIPDQTYTGSEITPEPTVTIGSLTLTKSTDYVYSYTNNTNVGTATVTVTFKGNYASIGSVAKTFTIVKATPTVTAPTPVEDLVYSGTAQALVTAGTTDFGTLIYSTDGTNYSTDIPTVTNAGTYTVYYKVEASDNWNVVDAQTVEVTIAPRNYTVTFDANGGEGTMEPLLLTCGGDWTALPANTFTRSGYGFNGWNTKANGSGIAYSDEERVKILTTETSIVLYAQWVKDITTCTATVPDQTMGGYSYIFYKFEAANSDAELAAEMGVVVKDGDEVLTLGTDYEFGQVVYASTGEGMPEDVGDECLLEIRGKGNYAGSLWAPFTITVADAGGTWGELAWAFHAGTLTISGTGAMDAASDYSAYPWFSVASNVKTIAIGEGVTTIADAAFAGTSQINYYSHVATASLPSTLTAIGDDAFAFCTGLTVAIPSGVAVSSSAFYRVGCVVGTLSDAADNADIISIMAAAQSADVTLVGRTLYKDGSWNTLCLPFAVSTAGSPLSGDGVQAMTLNTTTSNLTGSTLTLNFTAATTIPAGTPFIIKWDESGTDITNPVFEDVTIDAEKHDATIAGVTFTGTYAPVTITDGGDNTKLYLGAANKLYYPNAAMTIGCQRAYFQLAAGEPAGEIEQGNDQEDPVRAFVLNFGDESTGILSVSAESSREALPAAWYTLDGRRLDGVPTAKGLYIHGGKKVAIK